MRKILIFALCLILTAFWATAAKADSSRSSTITDINIDAGSKTEFTSEGKAQPPSVQELNFLHPMSLFVYAEDYRNIMTVIKFIYEHPVPFRWELEKWAQGSSSEITISSLNDEVNSKSPNDQILFTLDADLVKLTLDSAKKIIVAEAKHKGSGTGNTTSAKVISVQNLCKFALAAMNRGHNIFEVKAQIIASQVEGSAGGFALGGGMSNVNNGGTAFSIPAIIGWAKGRAGKIGLEGIQAELYYKAVISFEEDAAKTREHIEEIWKKQKEAAKEKEDMDKLRREAEKEKLQFEKKKFELEREKATRELEAMKPQPKKAEVAPTKPPAEKCEAEKKAFKEEQTAHDDTLRKLAEERLIRDKEKPEACPFVIEYPFNVWDLETLKLEKYKDYRDQLLNIPKIIGWIKEMYKKKEGTGEFRISGHGDAEEKVKDATVKVGFDRARYYKAHTVVAGQFDKELAKKMRVETSGKDELLVQDAGKNRKNRHVCIVWVPDEGGVHGHAHLHATQPEK